MRRLVIATLTLGAFVGLGALVGACSNDGRPSPEEESEAQLAQAREMFAAKCARCHGVNGGANGIFTDSLHPRPHKYTDPAWQASVTDDQIKEIIVRGGVNLGKSPAMPGNPTLKNHPEVLEGLVKLIRSFGKLPAGVTRDARGNRRPQGSAAETK